MEVNHLVTGRPVRVIGVAAARLAAAAARHVPRVGCALAAVLADHVGQAAALPAAALTVAVAG